MKYTGYHPAPGQHWAYSLHPRRRRPRLRQGAEERLGAVAGAIVLGSVLL